MENLLVLNIDDALKRMGGKKDLFIRLSRKFLVDYGTYDQQIRDAAANGDAERAALLAHTMKGMAGSLGGDALQTASDQLQKQLKNSGMEDFETPLDRFTDEFKKFKDALSLYLENQS